MNIEQTKVLSLLRDGAVMSAHAMVKRHNRSLGHYNGTEFADDVLSEMVKRGLINQIGIARPIRYSITSAGLAIFEKKDDTPLQITPGRLVSKMDGLYTHDRGDVASERGDHRHIASVGAAC